MKASESTYSTHGARQQVALRAITMQDIALKAGERGIILGKTRVGKSTLAEQMINTWRLNYPRARTIILDSKPRFKAEYELDGRTTKLSRRYASWDWGVVVPGSVVIPLNDIRSEIKHAWSLKYSCIIAQVGDRKDIWKLDEALKFAYMDRTRGRPLFIYVDEMNNFFRSEGKRASSGIIMALTSGGERSVAFLGAAQRPRNISVEAVESMTKCYWFYTPYLDDVKHLQDMGVPLSAKPPSKYYQFYFFDALTRREGMCQLMLNPQVNGVPTNVR